jgi:hypothetical protein
MLDMKIFQARMTEERLKAQLIAVQNECDAILGRFDDLGREPTAEEREARRSDFLASRRRFGELDNQLLALKCPKP